MKCDTERALVDTVRIHPRMKQERPALLHRLRTEGLGVSVPEMAVALPPTLFLVANLKDLSRGRDPIHIYDRCARATQQCYSGHRTRGPRSLRQ